MNYTLDLNGGLTQVLADETNMYVYGNGRIAQVNTTSEYFLGDALGSVRQMADPASEITFTQSYDPYGVVTSTSGESQTEYGFTGESYGDSTQLLYLRARYYNPADGRFQSRDTWSGDVNRPLSLNRWGYVEGNPVNLTDPSGRSPISSSQVLSNALSRYTGSSSSANILASIYENCFENNNSKQIEYIESFGITLEPKDKWTGMWLTNLQKALFTHIGAENLRFWLNGKPAKMVITSQGTCNATGGSYGGCTPGTTIYFWVNGVTANPVINMLHEMGHLVDNLWRDYFTNQLKKVTFTEEDGDYLAGYKNGAYTSLPHSGVGDVRITALISSTFAGQDAWQQRGGRSHWEDWADIFSNSMIRNIDKSSNLGGQINDFFKEVQIPAKGNNP